jgi:hypothetical protein
VAMGFAPPCGSAKSFCFLTVFDFD